MQTLKGRPAHGGRSQAVQRRALWSFTPASAGSPGTHTLPWAGVAGCRGRRLGSGCGVTPRQRVPRAPGVCAVFSSRAARSGRHSRVQLLPLSRGRHLLPPVCGATGLVAGLPPVPGGDAEDETGVLPQAGAPSSRGKGCLHALVIDGGKSISAVERSRCPGHPGNGAALAAGTAHKHRTAPSRAPRQTTR